jgi:ubiquitin C-terminal hydrolase
LHIFKLIMSRIEIAKQAVIQYGDQRGSSMIVFYSDLLRFFISGTRKNLSCWKLWDNMHGDRLLKQGVIFLPGISDFAVAVTEFDFNDFCDRVVKVEKRVWELLLLGAELKPGIVHGILPFKSVQRLSDYILEWLARFVPLDGSAAMSERFSVSELRRRGFIVDRPTHQATWREIVSYMFPSAERTMALLTDDHILLRAVHVVANAFRISVDAAIAMVGAAVEANADSHSLGTLTVIPMPGNLSSRSSVIDTTECVQVLRTRCNTSPCYNFSMLEESVTRMPVKHIHEHVWNVEANLQPYDDEEMKRRLKHVSIAEVLAPGLLCRGLNGRFQYRQAETFSAANQYSFVSSPLAPVVVRSAAAVAAASPNVAVSALLYESPARRCAWTREETSALITGLELFGCGSWKQVAVSQGFDGTLFKRTNVQLKDRWKSICQSLDAGRTMGLDAKLMQRIAVLRKGGARGGFRKLLTRPSDESSCSSMDDDDEEDEQVQCGQQTRRTPSMSPIDSQCDDPPSTAAHGLINPPNWSICWLNALMQCLASLPSLSAWTQRATEADDEFLDSLWQAMSRSLSRMQQSSSQLRTLKEVVECLSACDELSSYSDRRMHDPCEFLIQVASRVGLDQHFFVGIKTTSACLNGTRVHETVRTNEPALSILLPLPDAYNKTVRLQDLLSNYFAVEHISYAETTTGSCDQCKSQTRVCQVSISTPPQCLLLQLQRVRAGDSATMLTRHTRLNSVPVSCAPSLTVDGHVFAVVAAIRQGQRHYVAAVKRAGRWYLCDDNTVQEVTEAEAIGESKTMWCIFAQLVE